MQESGEHPKSVTEFLSELVDQGSFASSQMLGIDMPPVAVVEFKGFLARDRTCGVSIPREQSKLGEILRHDHRCADFGHAGHIVLPLEKVEFAASSTPCGHVG